MKTDIVTRKTIREIVAAYTQARDGIVLTFWMLSEREAALQASLVEDREHGCHGLNLLWSSRRAHDPMDLDASALDDQLKRLRREVWKRLVTRLEIWQMLSLKRAEELAKQLDTDDWPEITEANVLLWAQGFAERMPDMLQEAVREVFDWLRPGPWDRRYKTNQEFRVGAKVVISGLVEAHFTRPGQFRISYRREQNVRALENVFKALDGKASANESHQAQISHALQASKSNFAETEYFRLRAFKNGNGHLEFKRLDLVEQLNRRATGKELHRAAE